MLNGAAQAANMGVNRAVKAVVVAFKGGVEQLLPAQGAPHIAHKGFQQAELGGAEIDLLPIHFAEMRRGV